MNKDITRYLNDHLAGASAALSVIQEIADKHDAPGARDFFLELKEAVGVEKSILEDLLDRIGHDPGVLQKMVGGVASGVAGIKLMWEHIEPGELGLFEALELLAVGVHGKRLLWISLMEIETWFPEWNGIDFEELEVRTSQQRDDIEFWRLKAAKEILPDVERRMGIAVN